MNRFLPAFVIAGMLGFSGLRAAGQVGVYGQFSADRMHNLTTDSILYGGSVGVAAPLLSHGRFTLGGDIEGRFVHASGFDFDTVALGPRASLAGPFKLRPFAAVLTGFGRLKNVADQPQPTTDGLLEIKGGASRKLTPHLDLVADFSYMQFYAFGGEYNPKTFSAGVVYYFNKR